MTEATKVFVVDDEPGIRVNIASFLERAGYQVAVADDGEEESLLELVVGRPQHQTQSPLAAIDALAGQELLADRQDADQAVALDARVGAHADVVLL